MLPIHLLHQVAVSPAGQSSRNDEQVHRLQEWLIESALTEWKQLRDLEEQFSGGPWDDREKTTALSRSFHALHREWETSVEQLISHIRAPGSTKSNLTRFGELEHALGFTKARLMSTPESEERAFDQVRQGQTIPAKELRDELNARLRARREVPVA